MRMLNPLSTEWPWPRRTFTPFIMGDVFDDVAAYVSTASVQQSYDVNEAGDHILVSVDMPGVKKEDIKIEVQKNQLIIAGERNHRKFERTFTLPASINADKIEAQHENGVLYVAIPKAETAKGRSIQIQSGPPGFFSKLLTSKKENSKELKDAH
ncbi:MAG: Hsp20/alpha crystallin family protein [Bdellovibrionota bacterium]